MEFKDKLRTLRAERGISQQMLADQIFVSRSAIAKWENGLGFPSQDSYNALIAYFGVDADFFQTEKPETVIVRKNLHIRLLKLTVWIAGIMAFLCLCRVAFHWFTTVTSHDTQGMAEQAADYLGYDTVTVVKTVQRGDILAALCINSENTYSLCVFFRDRLFPDRWEANGAAFHSSPGKLSSWNYGDSQNGTVLIFFGHNLPEEIKWYSFCNGGNLSICPVKDRTVLDLFIIPDSNDINGSPVPLNENFQPLTGSVP